jgi:para-nitrobenzyl esterase
MLCLGLGLTAQTPKGDPVIASASAAIVDTESGKLQGFIHGGMYAFRGVQYAKAERFMPPEKVPKWDGIKAALNYGCISLMQLPAAPAGDDFFNPHRYWPQSDDCQFLNIWTPAIKDGKKRPVMVWIHGGGFENGSSIEQMAYDGENLSRKGDVVVISLNHRLNAIGYLDLSAYGPEYKYSGNAGIMDLVAALQWIKGNIAQFGGDPGNVTLFGQSGGGGKILTLMAAPAAKGLFQKAIVESGTFAGMGPTLIKPETSRRVAAFTLQNLGLEANQVDQLKTIPYDRLIEAANKARMQTAQEQGLKGPFGDVSLMWAPVVDGDYIPVEPAESEFAAQSKDIPLMIGTVLNEFTTIIVSDPAALESDNKNAWTKDEAKAALEKKYGDKADAVAKAFLSAYPDKKYADACFVDTLVRPATIRTARLKADQNGAPVYNYVFTWESPIMDGVGMAWHCSEIPFVFDNIALTETASGGGKAAYALSDKMSRAWVDFARSGNPNDKNLPSWPAFSRSSGATMIFDDKCVVRYNHDAELMSLVAE